MSGNFFSSGMLTNKGRKISLNDIDEIMKSKIENISIQIIPLKQNNGVTFIRYIGKFVQTFIHPAIFSPTLSHIAIQLTLENDYFAILEYGQYYSEDSDKKNYGLLSSFSNISNKNCREEDEEK